MPNLRLTRRAVDDIPFPHSGQVFYRDTLLSGFGLRVGANSKVFFAEGQVNRRTRRVTIGRADVFAPEIARKKALVILGEMADGRDPNAEKRKEKQERITLELAMERFFETRNTLSPSTVEHYRRTVQLYLKVWRKLEIPPARPTRSAPDPSGEHMRARYPFCFFHLGLLMGRRIYPLWLSHRNQ